MTASRTIRTPADWAKRIAMWLFSLAFLLFWYGLGKLELWRPATLLPLTAIDRAIPFLPWTVWLYGTFTWASLLAWLDTPDRRSMARLFATIAFASILCGLAFIAYPTTFPRELWPLPNDLGPSMRELAELRNADSPSNCTPSLHVALCFGLAATWSSWIERRALRPLPILWAVVVSACTLTTKQHYLIDVPSGLAVGLIAHYLAIRLVSEAGRGHLADVPALRAQAPDVQAQVQKLRRKVEGHQWALDGLDWPEGPLPPLDPTLVRLINELIYIEEIAGMNFRLLARASVDDDLVYLYDKFAEEERRHADGLRRLLELHGAELRGPGLGNTLVLDEFDALDVDSDADMYLVAVANPVFETMLDAGTVPFLRSHPALQSAWFEDFVQRVTRDEAAHMLLNWIIIRQAARRDRGLKGLRLLLNPSVYRGMVAVPFMSLDVYSLAHRMGYRFETLIPAFKKLWKLHRRYPELARYPLWWVFRLFVLCGLVATWVTLFLQRTGLLFIRFWCMFTQVTDALAWLAFGRGLLRKRGLPEPPR
ncbi:MAG: phosphatase PAP2 family protein [Myxococcales bacterium]|nr:phosphatase PAP2 family protein [Myxococcales bacterium]